MSKAKEAQATYDGGFNCCQSLISVYGPDFGYDREMMLRMGTAMGAGVARTKQTCGVVTGAVMVLGMKYGMKSPDDLEEKADTYEKAIEFTERFAEACGSCECGILLKDIDQTTKEGVVKRDAFCSGIVETGAKILEELL